MNSFIRSKYSSIRECFQVPQKYYPALSKVNLQKLKNEIDNGELEGISIRKKAVEYEVTFYRMKHPIVNVLEYRFEIQDCLNRLR